MTPHEVILAAAAVISFLVGVIWWIGQQRIARVDKALEDLEQRLRKLEMMAARSHRRG